VSWPCTGLAQSACAGSYATLLVYMHVCAWLNLCVLSRGVHHGVILRHQNEEEKGEEEQVAYEVKEELKTI